MDRQAFSVSECAKNKHKRAKESEAHVKENVYIMDKTGQRKRAKVQPFNEVSIFYWIKYRLFSFFFFFNILFHLKPVRFISISRNLAFCIYLSVSFFHTWILLISIMFLLFQVRCKCKKTVMMWQIWRWNYFKRFTNWDTMNKEIT